jgi:DNA invertase Pin-like site-specific DNA recombinase
MLAHIAGNGVKAILVETANRFARDLIVQETGWRFLQARGIELIAVDSPEAFLADTPTAVLIRQILGAVSQFEKASLVAKLKVARARKRQQTGKCEGRKGYADTDPALVEQVRNMRRGGLTLEQVGMTLQDEGKLNSAGRRFAPTQIARLLRPEDNRIGRQARASRA